jgi:hypothetical protein
MHPFLFWAPIPHFHPKDGNTFIWLLPSGELASQVGDGRLVQGLIFIFPWTCQPLGTETSVAGILFIEPSFSVTVVNPWPRVLLEAETRCSRLFDGPWDISCPSVVLVRDWQPATVARRQNAAISVGAAVRVDIAFIA